MTQYPKFPTDPEYARTVRRERRKAWLMLALSLAFVAAGVAMALDGEVLAGAGAAVFFGAVALVAIAMLSDEQVGGYLLLLGAIVMGIGCLLIFLLAWLSPESISRRRSPELVMVAAAAGVALFLGGGIFALIRGLRQRD
ncbi:hypothetical protein ACMYYO_03975 [Dermacoccaceae bacterium W4C1]